VVFNLSSFHGTSAKILIINWRNKEFTIILLNASSGSSTKNWKPLRFHGTQVEKHCTTHLCEDGWEKFSSKSESVALKKDLEVEIRCWSDENHLKNSFP
jgi:hypothetical protein